MSARQRHGHRATVIYRKLTGGAFRWDCKHFHLTEAGAFVCGTREVRRRYATARPRKDLRGFVLTVSPVLREAAGE